MYKLKENFKVPVWTPMQDVPQNATIVGEYHNGLIAWREYQTEKSLCNYYVFLEVL